ncbi:hypothetical protein B5M09_008981 [Aphanomyces astaci]|uniref:EF-hand domain-containing protein n=1 Tax=Aphanomyces astaci TaxID=112090 RepID=A0A3R7YG67_APHAT|nr:hypothetical protein B5M09_008981 [Aphanomyces astaci]
MLAPEQLARSHSWHAKGRIQSACVINGLNASIRLVHADIVRISLENKGIIGFIEVPDMKHRSLESVRPLILQTVDDIPLDFQFVLDGDKFTVYNASGDTFETWVPTDYKFGQLRKDAARYWSVAESQLVDSDGCVWPDEANMLSLLDADDLRLKKLVLTCKPSQLNQSPPTTPSASPRRARPQPQHSFVHSNYEHRLWYIFTYYCVHGDALDLLTMTAYQFNRFLKDCGLFHTKQFTPAMGDIIYAFEGKGKLTKQSSPTQPHSTVASPLRSTKATNGYTTTPSSSKSSIPPRSGSGKLDYDGFLNALLTIASRVLPHTSSPDDAFTDLLVKFVLPNATTWSQHTWHDHSDALQQPDVTRFVSKFTPALVEMFMFYTNQPVTDATKDGGHWMTFSDCMRFMQDFRFTELLLTTQECPELFLAACNSSSSSKRIHRSVGDEEEADDNDGMTKEALFRRQTMSFPAFLDMLGRAGLVALTRHRSHLEPLQCVKAVYHHMTRSLRGCRALEIMHNHGPVAIYASRFYAGSVAFNNKFLDMWRVEGSPDYVTGHLPTAPPPLTRGRASLHQIVHFSSSPPHSPQHHHRSSSTSFAAVQPVTNMSSSDKKPDGRAAKQQPAVLTSDARATTADDSRVVEELPRSSGNDDRGRAVLRQGAVFRKYGTWSAPHRRFVWLSDDNTHLHWRPLNKPDQRNEGLALASVQSLLSGHADTTRYAFMKYLTEGNKNPIPHQTRTTRNDVDVVVQSVVRSFVRHVVHNMMVLFFV